MTPLQTRTCKSKSPTSSPPCSILCPVSARFPIPHRPDLRKTLSLAARRYLPTEPGTSHKSELFARIQHQKPRQQPIPTPKCEQDAVQHVRCSEPPPPCRDPRRIELGYRFGHVLPWVKLQRHGRTLGALAAKLAPSITAPFIEPAVTARTELRIAGVQKVRQLTA